MQPLPRFRIYSRPRDYWTIARELATRRWSRGEACRELEEALQSRIGVEHALCTPKARVGIFLAIRALIEPGQKVVLSPYTISDVVNMVICAGGIPVFADIERETCNIDPAQIETLVDGDTGAVLVTHLHGFACDMDRIEPFCRERGVPLVEDAAQAFGARCGGRPVGGFADAGIFSFGMYKNVNAFFGGAIVTRRADLAERLRAEIKGFPWQRMRAYVSKVASGVASDVATWPPVFKSFTYEIFRYGFLHDVGLLNNQVTVEQNPVLRRELPGDYLERLTPMQARIIRSQLERVDDDIRARVRFATLYHEGLRDVPELRLPPLRTDFSHTYTYFPIQPPDRAALLRHMMRERRDCAAQHLHNCADLECFGEYHRDLPNARATARSVVLLPTYPRYSERDVERNVAVIRRYFGRA